MSVDFIGKQRIPAAMPARTPARPIMLALAGTLVAAAIGGTALLVRRRKRRGHADSIEPRTMPGSAADIHVGTCAPVDPR